MQLRLIADDLTGALDSAAQFTGLGPITVPLAGDPPEGNWALDSTTRDIADPTAIHARLAPLLQPAPGRIAFLKLDSLLRGHPADAIAAVRHACPGAPVILAPAFPHQGRVTRAGRQVLAATGEPLGPPLGLPLLDAETDADLDAIAAATPLDAAIWCGSAGLAGAIARRLGLAPRPAPPRRAPIIGLIGSNHPVACAQMERAGALRIADAAAAPAIAERLATGAALVGFDLPPLPPAEAAARIAAIIAGLLPALPRPGTLVAGGGETLRAICAALGVDRLDVVGQVEPGIPAVTLRGGAWDGLPAITRSGAFGPPDLLARLLEETTS